MKKGYFLKCEDGCKDSEGKGLVMFWSDRSNEWQLPQAKTEQSSPAKLTEHLCPVCQKPLEEYSYTKDGQAKSMLRCSDAVARTKPKHKDVAYFRGKEGQRWSPKFLNFGADAAKSSQVKAP